MNIVNVLGARNLSTHPVNVVSRAFVRNLLLKINLTVVACVLFIFLGLVLLGGSGVAIAATSGDDADFSCGGKLESEVWQLWDGSAKEYLRIQLNKRLIEWGDTYILYDIQTYMHNLVAMAGRCQRTDRLVELADMLGVTFASLEADPDGKTGLAWVCKGGAICNDKNRLINHEVMGTSVQFLGMIAGLANELAHLPKQDKHKFVEQTAITSIQHLLRWSSADADQKIVSRIQRTLRWGYVAPNQKVISRLWGDPDPVVQLEKLLEARPEDIKDGSSTLFFTDHHLWMIAIYADLAGLLRQQPELLAKAGLTNKQMQTMRRHLTMLLRLFASRITLMDGVGRSGKKVKLADIDRGFWRLYVDAKYAGYSGNEKPVTCISKAGEPPTKKVAIDASSLSPVSNIGWDVSHARRLVHAFDALLRNRDTMRVVFGIEPEILPTTETVNAFAQQMVVNVWNGDAELPLFSNYWSGVNGWFRVEYDNGTFNCVEGYPPFGLTDSFPTGGYATWSRYAPEVRPLGRRLYRLSQSNEAPHRLYIGRYYPRLGATASASSRMVTQLMFWPSLVESAH